MKRFPFYLGATLVTFSVNFLFLLYVQGPASETIRANPAALATYLTVAGLFSGGFGLILVANISRKGVGTNTPRTWLIVCTIVVVGVVFSVAIISAYGSPPGWPEVAAVLTSCSGDPEACTIALRNVGLADGETTSNCSLTFGGTTHSAISTVQTIKAGGPAALVTCTASAGTATLGSQVSGSITLTSGAVILFPAGG